MKYWIAVFLVLNFLSSCYYDNFSELHPEVGLSEDCDPDTSNVTFLKDIQPLLLNNCGSSNSGCHGSNAGNLIPLDTYDNVTAFTVTGQVLGSITHDPNYIAMPNNGDKLSQCKINKIAAWINQGLKP